MITSQNGAGLLRGIKLGNLLSYGPEAQTIALQQLNVLIGPNASGKSNLIEAVVLLRAAASDLRAGILRGGGVQEWIWKGSSKGIGAIEAIVNNPDSSQPLRHVLAFRERNQSFHLEDERIENERADEGKDTPNLYYHYQHGRPVANVGGTE